MKPLFISGATLFCWTTLTVLIRAQSSAGLFDKNNIISDADFTAVGTMSAGDIQTFLEQEGSGLATYSYNGQTAAQLIYLAAQKYSINPRIILTTLEKEQSLITTRNPSNASLNVAMGWDPYDTLSSHNFGDQIQYGTKQFRTNFDNPGAFTDPCDEKNFVCQYRSG